MYPTHFFIALLVLCGSALAHAETATSTQTPDDANSTNNNAKMVVALKDAPLSDSCKTKLSRISHHIIGKKRHRILEKNLSMPNAFHVFVLLSYNDQDSHLSFTAIENEAGCQIAMNESYELPANCLDARNSIFKRWKMLGKLDDNTIVMRYDYPRRKSELIADENARALGFLTQTERGAACLISKQQHNIPEPPQEDEGTS